MSSVGGKWLSDIFGPDPFCAVWYGLYDHIMQSAIYRFVWMQIVADFDDAVKRTAEIAFRFNTILSAKHQHPMSA